MRKLFYRHSPDQIAFDLDGLIAPATDPAAATMARILALPDTGSLAGVLNDRAITPSRRAKPASSVPSCGVAASDTGVCRIIPGMPEWTGLPQGMPDMGVSSLADVVVTGDVPAKYFLSPKACAGMVRRSARRGRALPDHLRPAIEAVAKSGDATHNAQWH